MSVEGAMSRGLSGLVVVRRKASGGITLCEAKKIYGWKLRSSLAGRLTTVWIGLRVSFRAEAC